MHSSSVDAVWRHLIASRFHVSHVFPNVPKLGLGGACQKTFPHYRAMALSAPRTKDTAPTQLPRELRTPATAVSPTAMVPTYLG